MTALDYAESEGNDGAKDTLKAAVRARIWTLRVRRRIRNRKARGEEVPQEDLAELAEASQAAAREATVAFESSLESLSKGSATVEPEDGVCVGVRVCHRARASVLSYHGVPDEDGRHSPSAFAKALRALKLGGKERAERRVEEGDEVESGTRDGTADEQDEDKDAGDDSDDGAYERGSDGRCVVTSHVARHH